MARRHWKDVHKSNTSWYDTTEKRTADTRGLAMEMTKHATEAGLVTQAEFTEAYDTRTREALERLRASLPDSVRLHAGRARRKCMRKLSNPLVRAPLCIYTYL